MQVTNRGHFPILKKEPYVKNCLYIVDRNLVLNFFI